MSSENNRVAHRLYLEYGSKHRLKVVPVNNGAVIQNLQIYVLARRDSDGKWFDWVEFETDPNSTDVWVANSAISNDVPFKKLMTEQKILGNTYLYDIVPFDYPENDVTDDVAPPTTIQFFYYENSQLGGLFATEEVMWVSRKFVLDYFQVTPIDSGELRIISG